MIKYQNKSEHELWMLWWKRHIFVSRRIHQKIDQLRKPVWILTAVLRNCGTLKEWMCISGINFTNVSKKSNKHPPIKKVCQCRKPTNCYIYLNEEHQQTITNGYNMYSNVIQLGGSSTISTFWPEATSMTSDSTPWSPHTPWDQRSPPLCSSELHPAALPRSISPRWRAWNSRDRWGASLSWEMEGILFAYIQPYIYIYTYICVCGGGNPVSHIFIHGSWWYTMIY